MGLENLSNANKMFLEAQGISLDFTFDAEGLSPNHWKQELKDSEKFILYNVLPCKKSGHTLKTKGGHCIICDSSKIAYASLGQKTGSIYIAGSTKGKILKIGCTTRLYINDRVKELNKENYGFSDWEILFKIEVDKVGDIEKRVHQLLAKYRISNIKYLKNVKSQKASELFSCDFEEAKEAVLESCKMVNNIQKNKNTPVVLLKNGEFTEYRITISFMKRIETGQNELTFQLDYKIAVLKNQINLIKQKKNVSNKITELNGEQLETKIQLEREIKNLKLERANTVEIKDVEAIPPLSFVQSLKEETEQTIVKLFYDIIYKSLNTTKVKNIVLKIVVERNFESPVLIEFKSSVFNKIDIEKAKALIFDKLSTIWALPKVWIFEPL